MLANERRWETMASVPAQARSNASGLICLAPTEATSTKTLLEAEAVQLGGAQLALLSGLQTSTRLQGLSLSPRVTASVAAELARCAGLEALELSEGATAEALAGLAQLPHLRQLSISMSWTRGATFEWLKQLPRLEVLHLSEGGDEVVEALAGRAALRELHFEHSGLSAAGLERLGALRSLQAVGLGEDRSSEADLLPLASLPNLRALTLPRHNHAYQSGFGDGLAERLSGLPLELLHVDGSVLTDTGVATLAKHPTLRWVELRHASSVTGTQKPASRLLAKKHFVVTDANDEPVLSKRREMARCAVAGPLVFWWEDSS